MNYWIFFTPLLTAAIGWALHKIATIYFIKRYWPKKQAQLSATAVTWAASQFSLNELEQKITGPEILEKAMPSIEKHIDVFLNEKLQQEIPMLGMFIGTKTTDKIKDIFINQLKQLFPTVMAQMAGNLKENFNIEKKISEKLAEPSVQKLLSEKLNEQLKHLPLLGLMNGLVAGLISVLIFALFG